MLPSCLTRAALRRGVVACGLAVAFAALPVAAPLAQNGAAQPPAAVSAKPNYDLASQWTSEKVGKLVFDTTVAPRWLESGDRFWYTYQTRDGRRFYLVDPPRKSKAPLFDHAKMAATLTSMIGQPYDAQHLPFSTVRFVKNDAAFQFDVQVPRDLQINAKPIGAVKKTTEPDPGSDPGSAAEDDQ